MKTYNQKARKREPFKPISNEFDFWVCYEVIFLCGVQQKYIKRKITSMIPKMQTPPKRNIF